MTAMIGGVEPRVILGVLFEAFETMLLPRRVARAFRLTRFFYLNSWHLWTGVGRADPPTVAAGHSSATSAPCRCWCSSASGPWADRRFRPAALVDRHAAERRRGRPPGRRALCVLQRRDVLHPGIWRRHADRLARPGPGRAGDRHRLRLPRGRHRLSARPVPGVLAPRGHDQPVRRPAGSPPTAGTLLARNARYGDLELLSQLLRSGSAGRPRCSRATSRSPS